MVVVTQDVSRGSSVERNFSRLGIEWLKVQLQAVPDIVRLWFGELDANGHQSGNVLSLEVRTDTPKGWLRLHASLRDRDLLDVDTRAQTQQAWVEVLAEFGDHVDPGFGQISYNYGGDGSTVLEYSFFKEPIRRRRPDYTILECRQWLRGYSWVTVVPKTLVAQLGGHSYLADSGAFFQVRPLRGGGTLLRATENFADFNESVAIRVFEALRRVLPPGVPLRRPADHGTSRHRSSH